MAEDSKAADGAAAAAAAGRPPPAGPPNVIEVAVIQARGLLALDGGKKDGTSDPKVNVRVSAVLCSAAQRCAQHALARAWPPTCSSAMHGAWLTLT